MDSVVSAPSHVLNNIFDQEKATLVRNEAKSYVLPGYDKPNCISTGSSSLDLVFGAGLPVGTITELLGAPHVGKSLLCMQLCVTTQVNYEYT